MYCIVVWSNKYVPSFLPTVYEQGQDIDTIVIDVVKHWMLVTHCDPLRAVLHVHPVILVVPNTLYAKVVNAVHWVCKAGEWLDEETFWHFALAR